MHTVTSDKLALKVLDLVSCDVLCEMHHTDCAREPMMHTVTSDKLALKVFDLIVCIAPLEMHDMGMQCASWASESP